INDLGSDDEKVWEPALLKLEFLDPRLNKPTESLLQDLSNPNARSRLASLLTINGPDQWLGYDVTCKTDVNNNGWSYLTFKKGDDTTGTYSVQDRVSDFGQYKTQWQRADQAIVLLQHIGTPEAIAIIRDMAAGHAGAQPTKVAKLALESLGENAQW